jgi:hypothetical protein
MRNPEVKHQLSIRPRLRVQVWLHGRRAPYG